MVWKCVNIKHLQLWILLIESNVPNKMVIMDSTDNGHVGDITHGTAYPFVLPLLFDSPINSSIV